LKDVNPLLVEEAMNYVVEMSKMSVNVTPKSKWFFISTSWIEKWKKYVHFDKLEG
jgi:hypothetical protein